MIDSKEMGEALDTIEEVAPEYAKSKAERIHLDDYRKVQLALLYEHAVGKTVAEKESWCKANAQYAEVLTEHANAGGVNRTRKRSGKGNRTVLETQISRDSD